MTYDKLVLVEEKMGAASIRKNKLVALVRPNKSMNKQTYIDE